MPKPQNRPPWMEDYTNSDWKLPTWWWVVLLLVVVLCVVTWKTMMPSQHAGALYPSRFQLVEPQARRVYA